MKNNNDMIIIDNLPCTTKIRYFKYQYERGNYGVLFKNSEQFYNYSIYRVEVLQDFIEIDVKSIKMLIIDNKSYYNITKIQKFTSFKEFTYYRIFLSNGYIIETLGTQVNIITSDKLTNLEYMNKLADLVSLTSTDGNKILTRQMQKINIDINKHALNNYLGLTHNIRNEKTKDFLIFPFGCNNSQFTAVKNALSNKCSIIEGPPGTGKTQTILNIIANLLINNKNCQIVSNNNYAILNIKEKLEHYHLSYLCALLGNNDNINKFLSNQDNNLVNQKNQSNDSKIFQEKLDILKNKIEKAQSIVLKIYTLRNEVATLTKELSDLQKEYQYFKNYSFQNSTKLDLNECDYFNLKKIYLELSNSNRLTFFKKLKYVYLYKVGTFQFYQNTLNDIVLTIQDKMYLYNIRNLKNQIIDKNLKIDFYKDYELQYIDLSLKYLRTYLTVKEHHNITFTKESLKEETIQFIQTYPVVLSTTYSARNGLDENFLFDYVIMDESSQIDIVTGTLALSAAKNAVIIGDSKQLPNVISNDTKTITAKLFQEYHLPEYYDYSKMNFLESFKAAIKDIPVTILREHYRCQPAIINFCNQEFYNNQLIIMTKDKGESSPIEIIRTVKGNHRRGNTNQRQIDIIVEKLKTLSIAEKSDIGIIAPYNEQVNLLQQQIPYADVSTVHKFQGREKDTIVITTVDDDLSDFVTDSKILNVAISRAKKKLIIVLTGNEIKNQYIKDLIDYTNYQNMNIENSKITSVFDLLYKQNEEALLLYNKTHQAISAYNSENIIYYLLKNLLKSYQHIDFLVHYPLNYLITDKTSLNIQELKYTTNHLTHLDFLIYNTLSKQTILVIEVDGYKYHNEKTAQHQRDHLKDQILAKYSIPILRLKTNESNEEQRIRNLLDTLLSK